MDRQPDRLPIRCCPGNPVPFMSRNYQVIPRFHPDRFIFFFEDKFRLATYKQHEFILILVVPKPLR